MSENEETAAEEREDIARYLQGQQIHDIDDFKELITYGASGEAQTDAENVGAWLNMMFGKGNSDDYNSFLDSITPTSDQPNSGGDWQASTHDVTSTYATDSAIDDINIPSSLLDAGSDLINID